MKMQSNQRRRVSWSDLPIKILESIAEYTSTPQDSRNFRAVCKAWRNSTQISTFLPRSFNSSNFPRKLVTSSIYLIRSVDSPQFRPWMILAVESTKGVTEFFNPFTRTPFLNLPQILNSVKYQSTRLATEYHIHNSNNDDGSHHNLFESKTPWPVKLVLYFNRSHYSVRNCRALALCVGGTVMESQPFASRPSFEKAISEEHDVDDIITFKGCTYALEANNKLRLIGNGVRGHVVYGNTCNFPLSGQRRRKRLVVSSSGDKLYMVDPKIGPATVWGTKLFFELLELRRYHQDSWRWISVPNFGDVDDQVLFFTRDHCFFVAAAEFPECQLKNCIVFSDDAFPRFSDLNRRWDYGGRTGNELAVYSLDHKAHYSMPIELYPGFPLMLSSPLPGVYQDASSKYQWEEDEEDDEEGEDEDEEEEEEEGKSFLEAMEIEIISNSLSEPEYMGNTTAFHSSGGAQADAATSLKVINDVQRVTEEGYVDAVVQRGYAVHLLQPTVKEVATLKFQGIYVQSEHLPVLEKVWIKHGDVLEGSAICNCDAKSMALALLAKMVIILQTNNGNTLTSDQANYLSSSLSDLQVMHLKVDWLVPYVDNALAMHKSKHLLANFVELQNTKEKVEEMEQKLLKLLSEVAEMKQGVDKDMMLLSRNMPVSGDIDLEKGLGEGLC